MDQKQIEPKIETVSIDIKAEMLKALEDMGKNNFKDCKAGSQVNFKQSSLITRLSNELKNSKNLIVEFKVDKAIKEGIKSGRYTRKGGVIVNTADNTVVKWLEEVKFAKAGKAINIATVAIDIFSEYALNEKLKEIKNMLETIEDYSEAEHWRSFLDGSSAFTASLRIKQNDDNRRQYLHDARRNFESAKNKNIVLLKKKYEKINDLINVYISEKLDNHKTAMKILEKINEIFPISSLIIQCFRNQVKIYELLGDFDNAKAMSQDAVRFQEAVYEYLYPLLEDKVLEQNRKEKFDRYVKLSKRYYFTGFFYNKVLKKELQLESLEPIFYLAKSKGEKKYNELVESKEKIIDKHNKIRDELLFLIFEASDSAS